jgi:hypothetical protein
MQFHYRTDGLPVKLYFRQNYGEEEYSQYEEEVQSIFRKNSRTSRVHASRVSR